LSLCNKEMEKEDGAGTVILATQEAEISRMVVQSQHGQIVHETLSRKIPSQKGWKSSSR
jgi:hypothetical protein